MANPKSVPGSVGPPSGGPAGAGPGRSTKFGAATEGWEAYNSWLNRVRQTGPTSRHAVISKALYSLSSYKNWADKARGAFDEEE
jgi:hypothetical protein